MKDILKFEILILSFFIGFIFSYQFKIKNYIHISLIIFVIHIFLYFLLKCINSNMMVVNKEVIVEEELTDDEIEVIEKSLNNNLNEILKEKEDKKIKDKNSYMPKNGPFDGLKEDELKDKMNYLTYITSNPINRMSYIDWKTHNDMSLKLVDDKKYLEKTMMYYPQLTKRQVNYDDCTNFNFGELSCNQQPDSINLYPQKQSMLVSGLNPNNINMVLREDFKIPNDILAMPSMYKNSPDGKNEKDISDRLCRGCVVGICENDICLNKELVKNN